MISPRHVGRLVLLLFLSLGPRAHADEAVRFQHAIAPGRLVEYDVNIEMTRDRRGAADWTQVCDRQPGRLTRYVLSAGEDRAQRVEMIALSPAEGTCASRDGVAISPRPSAAELRLDAGGVYMTVEEIEKRTAPALAPGGDDDRLIGAALLLAAPEWPSEPVAPEATWTSAVAIRGVDVPVTWRMKRDAPETTAANISLIGSIDAAAGISAGDAHGITMAATLVWDSAAGVAERFEGTARYRVSQPAFDETYTIRVVFHRRRLEDLDAAGRKRMRQSIVALNEAIAAERRGEHAAAARAAREFVETWPDSPWRPIIERLLQDLSNEAAAGTVETTTAPASTDELLARLSTTMKAWQEADRASDEAARRQLRASLAPLVAGARQDVRALLASDDPGPRAVGAFALAFTDEGLDLLALQEATGDVDGRVRAWAAYALAIRADPRTEFRTLQLLIRDDDANVRARGCEAVAACITPDSRNARAARTLLLERLADDFDGVRYHAAIALMPLAAPEDRPRIESVRIVEPSEAVVGALDRLLDRLSTRE